MTALSKIHKLFLTASAFAVFSIPMSASAAIKLDKIVKAAFYAVGTPGALDIEGVIGEMTVSDDGTNMVFTVPMASVKTGIDERDKHMLGYLESSKYPNAVLTIKKADIKWPTEVGKAEEGSISATFNVHGKDQPVTVKYVNRKSKTGWRVSADFKYSTDAAGIAKPDYMGIGVDASQHAEITIDLIDG